MFADASAPSNSQSGRQLSKSPPTSLQACVRHTAPGVAVPLPEQASHASQATSTLHNASASAAASGHVEAQAAIAQYSGSTDHISLQTTPPVQVSNETSAQLQAADVSPGAPSLAMPAHDIFGRDASPGDAAVQEALAVAGSIAHDLVPDSVDEVCA